MNAIPAAEKPAIETANGPLPIKVMIALVSAGQMAIQTAVSIAAMCKQTKYDIYLCPMVGFMVPENRCRCVAFAWREKCTHILWVDSDMGFPPDALDRLMEWRMPAVGVNYPTKSIPPVPTAHVERDDYTGPLFTEVGQVGIEEVKYLGFGLILTHIGVFNKLIEIKDGKPPFFHFEPNRHGLLWCTEDVYFAGRCRKAGIPLHVDHGLSNQVLHVGPWTYTNKDAIYGRNLNQDRAKHAPLGYDEDDLKAEDDLLVLIP